MDTQFSEYYTSTLLPELKAIENKRLEIRNKKISGIIILILVLMLMFSLNEPVKIFLGIACFTIVGYLFLSKNKDEIALYSSYKEKIINAAVNYLYKDIEYFPYQGISKAEFKRLCLFDKKPDRFISEDLFKGKKDKTSFCFSEVWAEYVEYHKDKNGSTKESWHTIFKGIVFSADFNKHFDGITIVLKNQIKILSNNSRVKLENPDFEKTFDVYSSDATEARYILTPKFMEALLKLQEQFNALEVEFQNGNIYICFPINSNLFELNMWRTVLNKNKLFKELNIINLITSIIDTLELNTRVWSK
jgi:hypothetical protein